MCLLSATITATAAQPTATIKKILSYEEADVELDSIDGDEFLTWVSPTKVVFGNYYNSRLSSPSCNTKKPHPECPKLAFDKHKVLMMFDITSQKTTFNIKNEFHQKQMEAIEQSRSYIYDKCSRYTDSTDVARKNSLKSGDGCLVEQNWKGQQSRSTFFHVSKMGQKTPIGNNTLYSILGWAWIDWLETYILGTSKSYNKHAENQKNIRVSIFFSPKNAKATPLKIRKGRLSIREIRPTRAGVVANVIAPGISSEMYGVTLWHGKSRYNIAGKAQKIEVSPDGCHIAYLTPTKGVNEMRQGALRDVTYSKLRVINVCEGFNVKKNANPFSKLIPEPSPAATNQPKLFTYFLDFFKSVVAKSAKNLSRVTQAF